MTCQSMCAGSVHDVFVEVLRACAAEQADGEFADAEADDGKASPVVAGSVQLVNRIHQGTGVDGGGGGFNGSDATLLVLFQ